MSTDSSEDAPRLRMAQTSPLLDEPEWIQRFRWMVGELLKAGRAATRHASMPGYRATVIEMGWKLWLDGLARHVYRVVEDGRNSPLIRAYTLDGNIVEAYQLACAAFDEAADEAGPNDTMMAALEDIAERLARWQPPAAPAAGSRGTPRGYDQIGGGDASGKDENADPLKGTLDLIPRSIHLPVIIGFLANKTGRRATLRDISRRVYKAVDKGSLAKTRKLITRNIPLLERRNTPLRLLWNDETKVASLVNRDGT